MREADKRYARFKKEREPHYKNAYQPVQKLRYKQLSLTSQSLPYVGGSLHGAGMEDWYNSFKKWDEGKKNASLGAFVESAVCKPLKQYIKSKTGGGVDIHKQIGKLPKPKGGWTLPGHKYTGPYNPLEKQLVITTNHNFFITTHYHVPTVLNPPHPAILNNHVISDPNPNILTAPIPQFLL